jgi:putative DNA primase/helicase
VIITDQTTQPQERQSNSLEEIVPDQAGANETDPKAWIAHALSVLMTEEDPHELRVLGPDGKPIFVQYYARDQINVMASQSWLNTKSGAKGVYFTINPVKTEFAQSHKPGRKGGAKGFNIKRRASILLDFDVRRPSNTNSTDEELAEALSCACAARDWLRDQGWPDLALTMTGNGAALFGRIDLENDDDYDDTGKKTTDGPSTILIKNVLSAVGAKFGTERVVVDPTVIDAPRLCKVPFTIARKGPHSDERPCRQSELLEAPARLEVIPRAMLQAVAALAPAKAEVQAGTGGADRSKDLLYDPREINPEQREARASSYLKRMDHSVSGDRGHNKLFRAACTLVRDFDLTPDVSFRLLKEHFNPRCDPEWSEAEIRHKVQDADKFDEPRGRLLQRFTADDLGNARRLVAYHGEDLLYVGEWKLWLFWDGARWQLDRTGGAMRLAKKTADEIYKATCKAKAVKKGSNAQRARSAAGLSAMLSLASTEPSIAVLPDHFDKDPFLLCCPNCVVDLRTGEARSHRREDYLTQLAGAPYDQKAECPLWLETLNKLFPRQGGVPGEGDPEMIGFVQRLCGLFLTGVTTEQLLTTFYGLGSNGKSVVINLLLAMLGDYGIKAAKEVVVNKPGSHPTAVADLRGKRLAVCSETSEEDSLDEGRVKELTGNERLKARGMRQDYWEFTPSHKLLLVTNHKPKIVGTDDGIWRRVGLLPFEQQFWDPAKPAKDGEDRPEHLRADKNLGEKLLKELPGVLAWAVRGCLAWQREGLKIPDAVQAATNEYRADEDNVALFYKEGCQQFPNSSGQIRTAGGKLFSAYLDWCEATGMNACSATKFGKRMKDLAQWNKSGGIIYYSGIAPREVPDDAKKRPSPKGGQGAFGEGWGGLREGLKTYPPHASGDATPF